jgi:hypothetical protein
MMKSAVVLVLAVAPLTAFADKNFEAGTGATYDCSEDPVVNIIHGDATYTLTGACTEVNLNGSKLVVAIADVATLNLNGTTNKITLTEVGTININGAKNKVTWKKAKKGKKPVVATNGKGNAVAKVK